MVKRRRGDDKEEEEEIIEEVTIERKKEVPFSCNDFILKAAERGVVLDGKGVMRMFGTSSLDEPIPRSTFIDKIKRNIFPYDLPSSLTNHQTNHQPDHLQHAEISEGGDGGGSREGEGGVFPYPSLIEHVVERRILKSIQIKEKEEEEKNDQISPPNHQEEDDKSQEKVAQSTSSSITKKNPEKKKKRSKRPLRKVSNSKKKKY